MRHIRPSHFSVCDNTVGTRFCIKVVEEAADAAASAGSTTLGGVVDACALRWPARRLMIELATMSWARTLAPLPARLDGLLAVHGHGFARRESEKRGDGR